jgi:hypothetical protein
MLMCTTMPSPSSSCYYCYVAIVTLVRHVVAHDNAFPLLLPLCYAIVVTWNVTMAKFHINKRKKNTLRDGGGCCCYKRDGNVVVRLPSPFYYCYYIVIVTPTHLAVVASIMVMLMCVTTTSPSSSCYYTQAPSYCHYYYYVIGTTWNAAMVELHTNKRKEKPKSPLK